LALRSASPHMDAVDRQTASNEALKVDPHFQGDTRDDSAQKILRVVAVIRPRMKPRDCGSIAGVPDPMTCGMTMMEFEFATRT
jgi:hypothetical protein